MRIQKVSVRADWLAQRTKFSSIVDARTTGEGLTVSLSSAKCRILHGGYSFYTFCRTASFLIQDFDQLHKYELQW